MCCEDCTDSDVEKLKEWHRERGFTYPFPSLNDAEFVIKRTLHDEDGRLVGAVIARKTVELYFLGDPTWRTPRWRLDGLKMLHEDVRQELVEQGYSDGHCWVPPEMEKSFGRRLVKTFGWRPSIWKVFSRRTA